MLKIKTEKFTNIVILYAYNASRLQQSGKTKLVEQSHPFTEVYTGIDRTCKRAVSESVISRLYKLELAEGTPLASDIFIFSYCTRGMAFVDIAYLKKENVQNGVIFYHRRLIYKKYK